MLRESTILDPFVSINQRKRSPYMANIGGGAPRTTRKVNLMSYTGIIHPINKINGLKKYRGRKKPTKRAGTSLQEIVKTQMEVVEKENASLSPHIFSLNYALAVEFSILKQQK